MSHETRLSTTIEVAERKALVDGLRELGLEVVENTGCRQYHGQTVQADVVIRLGEYDIGFVARPDGTFETTADHWGLRFEHGRLREILPDLDGLTRGGDIYEALMKKVKGAYNAQRVNTAFHKAGLFNVRATREKTVRGTRTTIKAGAR